MACWLFGLVLVDHPPSAVQVSALLVVQRIVVDPFASTMESSAVKFNVGAGEGGMPLTIIFIESVTVPPGPVQRIL